MWERVSVREGGNRQTLRFSDVVDLYSSSLLLCSHFGFGVLRCPCFLTFCCFLTCTAFISNVTNLSDIDIVPVTDCSRHMEGYFHVYNP